VTPFPVAALYEERKAGPIGLASIHNNATDKGWFSPADGVSKWKGYLVNQGYSSAFRKKTLEALDKVWKVISVLRGNLSALELIPFVEQVSPLVAKIISERENAEEILRNILLNSIMMLFSESLEEFFSDKIDSRPLGLVAENITIYVTGLEQLDPLLPIMDLPESIPHTHVWGVISEEFQKSQRKAYLIDTLHEGVWDATFRNILMPSSDAEIYFTQRKPDIMLVKSPKILKIFQGNITQLAQYPQLI
jgi:hypothetical protein